MELAIEPVNTTAIEKRQAEIIARVNAIAVDSNESLVACESLIVRVDQEIKEVEAELNPGIAKANDLHKHLTGQRAKYVNPYKAIKAVAKEKTRAYRGQEEEKRLAEEARQRAEARKLAEEQALAEAEELEAAGHTEAATEVLEQPVIPAPVVVTPTAPAPPPRMYREAWTARIDRPDMVPRQWCVPDEKKLNAHARSMKRQAVGSVPGVTFYNTGL